MGAIDSEIVRELVVELVKAMTHQGTTMDLEVSQSLMGAYESVRIALNDELGAAHGDG